MTEAAFVEELLFAEPVFVATPLVSAKAIDGQGFAIVAEVFDDGAVRHAIENGLADFVAKGFREASDLAVAARVSAETNSGMEWWSGRWISGLMDEWIGARRPLGIGNRGRG